MEYKKIIIGGLEKNAEKNILIFSPHADDEVLGCGGMIKKNSRKGYCIHLVVFGMGGLQHRHLDYESTLTDRLQELKSAAGIFGIKKITIIFPGFDMRLDTIPQLNLVSEIDDILDQNPYQEIYLPVKSHNHDHNRVHTAAIASLRPGAHRYKPDLIAMYESPYTNWIPPVDNSFHGKMYINIAENIEAKKQALLCYQSQIRPFPHPISTEAIQLRAKFRGMEAECKFAEFFILVKQIVH